MGILTMNGLIALQANVREVKGPLLDDVHVPECTGSSGVFPGGAG